MNAASPFWKAKRTCSSCQVRAEGGTKPPAVTASHMNLKARTASGSSTTTRPLRVEDRAAERAEMLEEDGDEPLVSRTLPDEAEPRGPGIARAARRLSQLDERVRRRIEEIGAPVEQPDVNEPGHPVQGAPPPRSRERGREEVVDVGSKAVERQDPAGRRELCRPDDVELQDIWIRRAGIQPLHVQLMALVGRVGCDAQLDLHTGMALSETHELPAHDLGFGAERAPGKGEPCRPVRAAAGSRAGRHDHKAREKKAVHPRLS